MNNQEIWGPNIEYALLKTATSLDLQGDQTGLRSPFWDCSLEMIGNDDAQNSHRGI
jgi:hypothetical protein